MINSFNPVQLSAWHAKVDMQYIVFRQRVLQYCTNHVTKSEPQSQSLKELFTSIVRGLREGNSSLKVNTVSDRDYSAQETCHLLLQLPMFKDLVILNLDGSRAVENRLEDGQSATALSIIDHYMGRPNSIHFNNMTLLEFARQYSMPKSLRAEPTHCSRCIVVTPLSADPASKKYEHYCHQSLMHHKSFRHMGMMFSVDMTAMSMRTLHSYSLATSHPVLNMNCISFFSSLRVLRRAQR